MGWRNSSTQYGWLSASLHWLVLVLVVAVYASMELRGLFPKGSAMREAMKTWHYVLGMSVLFFAAIRAVLYAIGPVPVALPTTPKWQSATATWMKAALYCLLLGMPLLGWALLSADGKAISFFGIRLPALLGENAALAESLEGVHESVATVGYFLIGLHAAAALYHHYLLRDDTLRRMLPRRR